MMDRSAQPAAHSREPHPRDRLDTSIPVVLLQGAGNGVQHGMLAAARSLGRLGVSTSALIDQAGAATRSKYLRNAARLDLQRSSGAALVEAVRAVTGRDARALVVPVDDVATSFAEDAYTELKDYCLLPRRPANLCSQLLDKRQLLSLLSTLDVPAPRSYPVSNHEELHVAAGLLGFPCVLKTTRTTPAARHTNSVTVVHGIRELLDTYTTMETLMQASALLQEYIAEPQTGAVDWMFNGCFAESSRCLFRGTGLKLRQWPIGTGAATLGVSLPNSTVEEQSIRLVNAVRFSGMIDIDYRLDVRDGRYKLLDVNPRLGASFRLFVSSDGTDVLRTHYRDMTGQPVSPASAREGRRWMVELRDLQSSLALVRSGRRSLRDWRRSLHGVEELAWFDREDLRPFGEMLWHYLRRYSGARR